ncbi:MAG: helix-turn-helix transcriptional regulator [Planctomycetota bacterium]
MFPVRLPLHRCPEVVNLGVGVHGGVPVERYRSRDLWHLHLYQYRAWLTLDGERVRIEPGVVTIVPPGTAMVFEYAGRSEHAYAHVRLSRSRSIDPVVPVASKPAAFAQLDVGVRAAIGWWPNTPARSVVRLWDVLWQLTDVGPVQGDAVDRLRSTIEQRLSDPLPVARLLAQLDLGYSHNHLLRLFKERTGKTIAGYIRQRRSEVATGLLRSTSLPIKAVAAAVGVPDPHAFNKLIRQTTGQPPSALRGE